MRLPATAEAESLLRIAILQITDTKCKLLCKPGQTISESFSYGRWENDDDALLYVSGTLFGVLKKSSQWATMDIIQPKARRVLGLSQLRWAILVTLCTVLGTEYFTFRLIQRPF